MIAIKTHHKSISYSIKNSRTSFKVAKIILTIPATNFRYITKTSEFSPASQPACLPACQPVNRNRLRAHTTGCIAFKLSETKGNFRRHEPLLFQ